mgnify:CR=1 FL=1
MAAARALFRDVGNVTMDLDGVEHIQLNVLGGADTITVNDLTGTDVNQVAIDLSATAGQRHRATARPDTVIANGTAGDDQISVVTSGTRSSSTVWLRRSTDQRRRESHRRLARRQRRRRQRHHRRVRAHCRSGQAHAQWRRRR